jgi:hypothetical protein
LKVELFLKVTDNGTGSSFGIGILFFQRKIVEEVLGWPWKNLIILAKPKFQAKV